MATSAPVGGGNIGKSLFHEVCSVANLFDAWNEYKRGKRKKKDVLDFELNVEQSIFDLSQQLLTKTYTHEEYQSFFVCDPKRRHIHKASVRDRVLHQALFRVLYPVFDKHFIFDVYSSRDDKGTHKGVLHLQSAIRKVSKNWKSKTYVLKCDIRKFFDSIDHEILRELIVKKVSDSDLLWLIDSIFDSFEKESGKGLPLGNVTSQLFANVYLNELDQFAKHVLKAEHYFRYCDDFVIVHEDREFLEGCITKIENFLWENLKLKLHPNKVEIRKVSQGVDFLGYVILPHAKVLRTKTKRRISRKLREGIVLYNAKQITKEEFNSIVSSYLGVFSHARARKEMEFLNKIIHLTDQERVVK